MSPKFTINSLYICVKDMERALHFYGEFLGQKPEAADEVFSVFNIGGFRYCLFEPAKVKESVVWGDSCLPSFETDDIDAAMAKVEQLGCPIVFPLKQIGSNLVFEFTDTEGNDIEVFSLVGKGNGKMILESGSEECPCKRVKCERRGKCAECLEHHKTMKNPPYCKREKRKKSGT